VRAADSSGTERNVEQTSDRALDSTDAATPGLDVIRAVVADDLRQGKHARIVTRFPPEPNGYLHIGHATSVALNFGIAEETGGRCHLRFDDTNPETEDEHYVQSIQEAVRWLGYDWGEHLYFASDYFEQMYVFAEHLIREGKAYVDRLSEEEIREYRGTVTEPGRDSPYRKSAPEENLAYFRRMRAGEFPDGAMVLRAKIDMASPNMLLRDPVLYRIRHATHYRTGDKWCIYPLYDYAHPIEDAIECVTHSICTMEFENNRPVYDWVVENIPRGDTPGLVPPASRPRQYEFARRTLDYTVMSKRKLLELVRDGLVSGWDDPRMPTLAGLRRRGVTPEAIRAFTEMLGIARTESRADIGKLEYVIRDDLNQRAPRVLAVLDPLRVVLTNYPEGESEELDAPSFPHDVPREGSRPLPFSRELFIDREDFNEDPPRGFHRLVPGGLVRLRHAYVIRCDQVVKGEDGEIEELRCSYFPETRGGTTPEGVTVKGTIQWVSAPHALPCEVRLYDRLFTVPDPDAGERDFKEFLNPKSLITIADARVEPSVRDAEPGSHFQFERLGYFCIDLVDSRPDALVFNRTVALRDTWAKQAASALPEAKPAKAASPRKPPRAPKVGSGGGATPEPAALDPAAARWIEAAIAAGASEKAATNWVVQELPRVAGEKETDALPFTAGELGELVVLVEDGTISSAAGREVLAVMATLGGQAVSIVERLGLRQVSDPAALAPVVERIIAANAAKADEYRAGKTGLLGFFIGQVMRESGGTANPELVREMVRKQLEG
jgi:glutaminyl-tRNA synthetase